MPKLLSDEQKKQLKEFAETFQNKSQDPLHDYVLLLQKENSALRFALEMCLSYVRGEIMKESEIEEIKALLAKDTE